MSEQINRDRRRFLGTAVMTLAAAELGMAGFAKAQAGKTNAADAVSIKPGTMIKPGAATSFGALKQVGVRGAGKAAGRAARDHRAGDHAGRRCGRCRAGDGREIDGREVHRRAAAPRHSECRPQPPAGRSRGIRSRRVGARVEGSLTIGRTLPAL
jgi:hypothetical protein